MLSKDFSRNISDVYIGTYLSARVSLKPSTIFGDYLPGETEGDKIRYFLKGIVSVISPRFAPNVLDWNYEYGKSSLFHDWSQVCAEHASSI